MSSLQNENQQLRESLSTKSRKPPMLPRKTGRVSTKEKVQHDPRLAHVLKTALGIYVYCISDDQYTPVFYWIYAIYSSILIYFGYLLCISVYFWIFTMYFSIFQYTSGYLLCILQYISGYLLCISVYFSILLDIYFVYFSIFLDIYYVFQYTSVYFWIFTLYTSVYF